jgi:hypothetical protein
MENPGHKEQTKGFFRGLARFFRWFWRNRRVQALFFIFVIALPVFLIIYGIILPVKNYQPYPTSTVTLPASENGSGTADLTDAQIAEVKSIVRKERENAFQKSRLALAEKDSIYMVLDVPAKQLVLEIKGVTVKKVDLLTIGISNRFSLISHENLLPWISNPFILEKDFSTIPKSPIVVKQAPKDTIEAQLQSTKPTPPDSTNVYYTLYFDRNLVLEIEQSNPLEAGNTEKVITYQNIKRKESTRSVFRMLRNPQQTDQPMLIRLTIGESEARAIYRAVPAKSRLILKL